MGSKHLTNEEKETIFKMFNEGYNTVEISEVIRRDSSCVQRFLKRNGIALNSVKRHKVRLNNQDVQKIIELYQQGKSGREILKHFPGKLKCDNTIVSILRENNIPIRPRGQQQIIEHEDFFEVINAEEKAYYLGLFVTDGYVLNPPKNGKKQSTRCGMELQEEDSYILEYFLKLVGSDKELSSAGPNTKYFVLYSNKMGEDLARHGVIPKKCHVIDFPTTIPDHLMHHFVRGLLDGDGFAAISNANKFSFGFCGNINVVTAVRDLLVSKLSLNKNAITKSNCYKVAFSAKKDVLAFYDYIYKDATVYLKRKKAKFDQVILSDKYKDVNTVVTQKV